MTLLLAYASPPELAVLAGCLVVALLVAVVAFRDDLRAWRRQPAHRPTRTVYVEIVPRLVRSPRSHLRTLGPRPFDWSIDDPDLAPRRFTVEQIAAAYDVPLELVTDRR